MALTKNELIDLYRKRAGKYDFTANIYYLLGFRERLYRKMAVDALALSRGDTVVEIGCGTGLNFPFLLRAIGPEGRLIGVELTDLMLQRARERVEKNGWTNVELVQADAALYRFPRGIGGVISTFAITLIPEYDGIIRRGAEALARGGRFVVLDFKKPENRPMWLIRFGVAVTGPFGVSIDLAGRHPWESMKKYFKETSFKELYFGFAYISVGTVS